MDDTGIEQLITHAVVPSSPKEHSRAATERGIGLPHSPARRRTLKQAFHEGTTEGTVKIIIGRQHTAQP